MSGSDRTAAATAEHQRRASHRAVDDPTQLARAARIVRAALERERLTLADLVPAQSGRVPVPGSDTRSSARTPGGGAAA